MHYAAAAISRSRSWPKSRARSKGTLAFRDSMSPTCALALAPVGVGPESPEAVGSARCWSGRASSGPRRAGDEIIFVVGEPAYYARFGFDLDAAKPFPCAYAGPYFMALRLTDAQPGSLAPVIYPAAFDDLEVSAVREQGDGDGRGAACGPFAAAGLGLDKVPEAVGGAPLHGASGSRSPTRRCRRRQPGPSLRRSASLRTASMPGGSRSSAPAR